MRKEKIILEKGFKSAENKIRVVVGWGLLKCV
jgi:hypothetical protein